LDGRGALVTGGGGGIGRGICLLLAREGAGVVVADLGTAVTGEGADVTPAQKVVNEIRAAGGKAVANTGNVADFAQAQAMVDQAVKEFGRIDILVNTAGILRDRMIFNMSEAEWDAVIAVHLKGTFNTTRWASARMREQRYGRIVNFSSVSAWGNPGQPNYAAAKHGILGLTLTCANSLYRYNVTANAIVPGTVATRMVDATPRGKAHQQETGKTISEASAGTELDPVNVAPIVVYLCTEEAGYINGQFIGIQGYTLSLYSQTEAVRFLRSDGPWRTDTLFDVMPRTIAEELALPPALGPFRPGQERPKRRTELLQADPAAWKEVEPGVQYWVASDYFDPERGG
jgi:NAD(P)-dependent dehydrogenase (short-subunit alcohol dehydrogenase family)